MRHAPGRSTASPSGGDRRPWARWIAGAVTACVLAAAVVVIQLHSGTPDDDRPAGGGQGFLLVPVGEADGAYLWVWDLAAGTATRGPRLGPMPAALVASAALHTWWIGITTSGESIESASVLRRLGPDDRPIDVARGRLISWSPTGGYVTSLQARRTDGCRPVDIQTWFVSSRTEQRRSIIACGEPTGLVHDRIALYLQTGHGAQARVVQVGDDLLRPVVLHADLLSVSTDSVMALRTSADLFELRSRAPPWTVTWSGAPIRPRRGTRVESRRVRGLRSRFGCRGDGRLPGGRATEERAWRRGPRRADRLRRRVHERGGIGRRVPRGGRQRHPLARRRDIGCPRAGRCARAAGSDPLGLDVAILPVRGLMDIAIVGAGTVGTAVAVAWARAGHRIIAVSGREATRDRAASWLPGVQVLVPFGGRNGARSLCWRAGRRARNGRGRDRDLRSRPRHGWCTSPAPRGLDVRSRRRGAGRSRSIRCRPSPTWGRRSRRCPGVRSRSRADDEDGFAPRRALARDLGRSPVPTRRRRSPAVSRGRRVRVELPGRGDAAPPRRLFAHAGRARSRRRRCGRCSGHARQRRAAGARATRSPALPSAATPARSTGTSPRSPKLRRTLRRPPMWRCAAWRSTVAGDASVGRPAPSRGRGGARRGGADPRRGGAPGGDRRLAGGRTRRSGSCRRWARCTTGIASLIAPRTDGDRPRRRRRSS